MRDFVSKIFFYAALVLVPLFVSFEFADPYLTPKWLVLYGVTFCLLLLRPGIEFSLSRLGIALFSFLVLFQLSQALRLGVPRWEPFVLERLSFLLLLLLMADLFRRRLIRFERIAQVLVAAGVAVAIWGLEQIQAADFSREFPYHVISSSFGHSNMAAQFVGLALLFLGYLFVRAATPTARIALGLAGILLAAYLVLSSCRSALLGLALACLYWAWHRRQRVGSLFLISGALAALLFALNYHPPSTQSAVVLPFQRLLQEKADNANYRLELWSKNLALIRQNPWGIGPGAFEYGFLPYRNKGFLRSEDWVENTPHNELLRFLSEEGWAGLVLYLVLAVFALGRAFRLPPSNERALVASLVIFFSVEALFQFPWMLPVPFFLSALLGGYCMSLGTKADHSFRVPRLVLFFLALLIGVSSIRMGVSRYFEMNSSQDLVAAEKSCRLWPSSWRACANLGRYQMAVQNFPAARETFTNILKWSPYHFVSVRELEKLHFLRAEVPQGCALRFWRERLFSRDWRNAVTEVPLCASFSESELRAALGNYPDLGPVF